MYMLGTLFIFSVSLSPWILLYLLYPCVISFLLKVFNFHIHSSMFFPSVLQTLVSFLSLSVASAVLSLLPWFPAVLLCDLPF